MTVRIHVPPFEQQSIEMLAQQSRRYVAPSRARLHTVYTRKNRHPRVASEVPVFIGGPSRTRTVDPLIKSQLLCQLS